MNADLQCPNCHEFIGYWRLFFAQQTWPWNCAKCGSRLQFAFGRQALAGLCSFFLIVVNVIAASEISHALDAWMPFGLLWAIIGSVVAVLIGSQLNRVILGVN